MKPKIQWMKLGAFLWISSIQTFLVQWIVARAWPKAYNPSLNFISDLGNTSCGWSGGRYICSPEHHWMNASLILLGLTVALGALLAQRQLLRDKLGIASTILFVASGAGIITIGMIPENQSLSDHIVGAYIDGYAGVLAILFFALSLRNQHRFQGLSTISLWLSLSLLSLSALYTINYYLNLGPAFNLGIGPGGMEKLINYPIYAWLATVGFVLVKSESQMKRMNSLPNN